MGAWARRKMDAGTDRRASRVGPRAQRGDIQGAPQSRADDAAAPDPRREDREAVHFWVPLVSTRPQGAGTHHAPGADRPGERRGALSGRDRGVGPGGPRVIA